MKGKHEEHKESGTISKKILTTLIVIVIIGSLVTVVWYYFGSDISNKFSSMTNKQEIDSNSPEKDEALQVAYKKFKELGESDLNKNEFKVIDVNNNGVESYYISSPKNSVEVRKDDMKIIRLNSVKIPD